MKRNSKFLLLLALIMSGIIGVYFIGCEGDTTTITEPPPPDKVIGSVHGVVTNDIDNTPLPGVQVVWVNKGETHTATSDALGYFVTDGVLGSGDYEFTFSVNGYSVRRATAVIPDIDSLRGEPGTPVSGDIPFSRQLDIGLFPLTASLTGKVFTARPGQAPAKEIDDPMAADPPPPDYLRPAETLQVHILFDTLYAVDTVEVHVVEGETTFVWTVHPRFPLNISPDRYVDETDAEGVYLFGNLPAVTGGKLLVYSEPFQRGDTLFVAETLYVSLLPNATVTAPSIYADIVPDPAEVMNTNFETGKFELDSNLIVAFSKEMDTATVRVTLKQCDGNCNNCTIDLPFSFSWSNGNRLLTIDPTYALIPDLCYHVEVIGKAMDGNALAPFTRTFETIDGMRFVSTNLDDYSGTPGSFLDFPLDSNIILCFDMVPDLTNPNTSISLIDTLSGQHIDYSDSVDGNCVVIDPANPLESNRTYRLYFKIYSTLSVDDYEEDSDVLPEAAPLIITVECTEAVPAQVTGFDLVSPDVDDIDWNTTELTFKWNVVPGADLYQIYAKDNHKNTDFTLVATITAVDYVTWQTGSVDFGDPANWQFDLYQDDTLCPDDAMTLMLITPFSDSNAITFQVRAVNTCHGGQYGPFSSSVTLEDEVAPHFELSQTSGNADQVGKSGDDIFIGIEGDFGDECWAWIEYAENVDPTFEFIEGGCSQDPAPSPVTWVWNNTIRDGEATFTVPAGTAAAGDSLVVSIVDNSGNVGVDTVRLLPWFQFSVPVADSGLEAGETDVKWGIDYAPGDTISHVNLWLSFDSGATWIDSTPIAVPSTNTYTGFASHIPDTVMIDDSALVRLQDAAGGCYWYTDVFTISGIMMTGPPEDYSPDTVEVFDRGVTDSTGVPLTWDFVGISDVIIQYYAETPNKSLPVGPVWTDDITVSNTGSYNWYPPQWAPEPEKAANGGPYTYRCWVRVADADLNMEVPDGRPADDNEFSFIVFHDIVHFTDPSATEAIEDTVRGGEQYNIRWWNKLNESNVPIYDTLSSVVTLEYVIDPDSAAPETDPTQFPDAMWIEIDNAVDNMGEYAWQYPPRNTPTEYAWMRLITGNDDRYYSQRFVISGLVVTSPVAGNDWDAGKTYTVSWDNGGSFGMPGSGDSVLIEYWNCEDTDWDEVGSELASDEEFDWLVPNEPCVTVTIRITEKHPAVADSGMYDVSDTFTIAGYQILTPPYQAGASTDTLYVGDQEHITWATIGDPDGDQFILVEYASKYDPPPASVDTTWDSLDVTLNDGDLTFIVPDPDDFSPGERPDNNFYLRIRANAGVTADTTVKLRLAFPEIEVTHPESEADGDTIMLGTLDTIRWNSIGLVDTMQTVTIQLWTWDAVNSWVNKYQIEAAWPSPNRMNAIGQPGYHMYFWTPPINLPGDTTSVTYDSAYVRFEGTSTIENNPPGDLEGKSAIFRLEKNPGKAPLSGDEAAIKSRR